MNYETGAGTGFNIYGGGSSSLYASFTGAAAIKFPGLAASSGHNCLQIDNSGYLTNTGAACGTGSGSGTVNSGATGQIAYYAASGTTVGGMNTVPLTAGGTGASTAAVALTNLGALPVAGGALTGALNGTSASFSGALAAGTIAPPTNAAQSIANLQGQGPIFNVLAYGAVADAYSDTTVSMTAGSAIVTATDSPFSTCPVGKGISVEGAGVGGVALFTSVLSCADANHATLAAAASTTTTAGSINRANGLYLANAGTSGYYSAVVATTTSGSGAGATIAISAQSGTLSGNADGPDFVLNPGSGYALGDKVYPTVTGSSGDAYFTVVAIDGAGAIVGTDNYTAFHAANLLAQAAGGTVYIPAGTGTGQYLFNTAQNAQYLTFGSNTRLEMDPAAKVYPVNVALLQGAVSSGALAYIPSNTHNVKIRGLHCSGEWLAGPVLGGYDAHGSCITFQGLGGINDVSISDSIFENLTGNAIEGYATNDNNIKIHHNTFAFTGNTAINYNAATETISDNFFDRTGGVELGGPGLHLTNNIFRVTTQQYGVQVGGVTAGPQFTGDLIIGNEIWEPARGCLSVGSGVSYSTVALNRCENGMNNYGIVHSAGSQGSGHVLFEGNTITGNNVNPALYLAGAQGDILRNNTIVDPNGEGINTAGSTGIDSVGNSISVPGGYDDLYIDPSSSGRFQDYAADGIGKVYFQTGSVISPDSVISTPTGQYMPGLAGTAGIVTNTSAGLLGTETAVTPAQLPKGTNSAIGGLQCDGTTTTCASGVISSASAYTLPIATPSTLGGIKPDGTTVTVNASTGVASATPPVATTSVLGGIKPDGVTITVNGSGVASANIGASSIDWTNGQVELVTPTYGSAMQSLGGVANGCGAQAAATIAAGGGSGGNGLPLMLQYTSAAVAGDCSGWMGGAAIYYVPRYPVQLFKFAFPNTSDYGSTNSNVIWLGMYGTCSAATMLASATPSGCDIAAIRYAPGTDTVFQCVGSSHSGSIATAPIGTVAPSGTYTLYTATVSYTAAAGLVCTINGTSSTPITSSSNLPPAVYGENLSDIFTNTAKTTASVHLLFNVLKSWDTAAAF